VKALVFERPGVASVMEREAPQIGADEVLVRLSVMGICHSDFELLAGRYFLPVPYPVIPGHEWVGRVERVGADVRDLAPGTRVVGECAISPRLHFGFTTDGAGAEFFRVRADWLHRVPDSFSDTTAALVEPFSIGYAAIVSAGGVDPSDRVIVLGGGPIGMCSLVAARACGAAVALLDPIAERRALAEKLGADMTADPLTDDGREQVARWTDGAGAEVVIEASGNVHAAASALELAGYEGRVVAVGIDVGGAASARLGLVQSKSLHVQGMIGSAGLWPRTIRFLERTRPPIDLIVTAERSLEQALDALELSRAGGAHVKVHLRSDG
jgi:L-iditol 2-dehydrogenase